MEVKKIVEGMTAPEVAKVIDDNFKAQNEILETDIKKQNNVIGVSEYKAFSESETVSVGELRLKDGYLYECIEETTGEWDAAKWKSSSFKKETEKKLSELGSKVDDLNIETLGKYTKETVETSSYNIYIPLKKDKQYTYVGTGDSTVVPVLYYTDGTTYQLDKGYGTVPNKIVEFTPEKDVEHIYMYIVKGGTTHGFTISLKGSVLNEIESIKTDVKNLDEKVEGVSNDIDDLGDVVDSLKFENVGAKNFPKEIGYLYRQENQLVKDETRTHILVPVNSGDSLIFNANENNVLLWCVLKQYVSAENGTVDLSEYCCEGFNVTQQNMNNPDVTITIPSDGLYFCFNCGKDDDVFAFFPKKLVKNGVDLTKSLSSNVGELNQKMSIAYPSVLSCGISSGDNMILSKMTFVDTSFENGIFGNQASAETSDFIDVSDRSVPYYLYTENTFTNQFSIIRFYDKDKNVISSLIGGNSGIVGKIVRLELPNECVYIRYARGVNASKTFGVYKGYYENFEDSIKSLGVNKEFDEIDNVINKTQEFVSATAKTETGIYLDDNGIVVVKDDTYRCQVTSVQKNTKVRYTISNLKSWEHSFKVALFDRSPEVGMTISEGTDVVNVTLQPDETKTIVFECKKKGKVCFMGYGAGDSARPLTIETAGFDTIDNLVLDKGYVLWIGTSIPESATYPNQSCKKIGATCLNHSLGSSCLTFTNTHPSTVAYYSGRNLTATVAELETLYRQDVSSGKITEAQLEQWKNYSYERSIIPYIDGTNPKQISVLVIDHGYNDRDIIYNQLQNKDGIDWNSKDRSNFVGAFNYLVDKLLRIKPNLRIVISGYFQNHVDTLGGKKYYSKEICEMQCMIAEKYGFIILKAWEYTQINDRFIGGTSEYLSKLNDEYGTTYEKLDADAEGNITSMQLYCPDGVHPHSDVSQKCNIRLNSVYTKLMRDVIDF